MSVNVPPRMTEGRLADLLGKTLRKWRHTDRCEREPMEPAALVLTLVNGQRFTVVVIERLPK